MSIEQIKKDFTDLIETFDKSFRDMILSQKFIVRITRKPYVMISDINSIEKDVIIIEHPHNSNVIYIISDSWENIEVFLENVAVKYNEHADFYREIFKKEVSKHKEWIKRLETGWDGNWQESSENKKEFIRRQMLSK